MKKILVTGPTGLVGINLIRKLVELNYAEIHILVRKTSNLKYLPIDKLIIHYGDTTDLNLIKENYFENIDEVINIAGVVSLNDRKLLHEVNVKGVQNVFECCIKNKIKKVIHISSISAIDFGNKNKLSNENSSFGFEKYDLPYNHSKRKGEEIALSYVEKGLNVVCINPGFILGPFDVKPSSGALILETLKAGFFYPLNSGTTIVHVEDVVFGIIKALECGKNGERYIISGENVSYYDIFTEILKNANKKRLLIPIPKILGLIAGYSLDFLGKIFNKKFNLNKQAIYSAYLGYHLSNEKSKKEFNIIYKSYKTAIKDAYEWFKKEGYLDA